MHYVAKYFLFYACFSKAALYFGFMLFEMGRASVCCAMLGLLSDDAENRKGGHSKVCTGISVIKACSCCLHSEMKALGGKHLS